MIFKNILLEIVNFYHKEFLKANKIKIFDPFKLKVWHSTFDLEKDIKEIPIFEIAEKPSVNIISINEYLKQNSFKSDLIKRAIEKCNMENKTKTNNDASSEHLSSAEEKLNEKKNIKTPLENLIKPELFQKVIFLYFIFFLSINKY
jgi:hypothetical protein